LAESLTVCVGLEEVAVGADLAIEVSFSILAAGCTDFIDFAGNIAFVYVFV
jgi:hypothetical protein